MAKNEKTNLVTKIDEFISARGTIVRFQDYKLSGFKTRIGGVESRIRKFTVKSEHKYFYQIEKNGEYKESVASIEYEDLVDVIGSLDYIVGTQSSWYIVLGNGSNETIFISDVDRMISAFDEARLKIEGLRK